MKSLLTVINEYKENPSEQLRSIIWKAVMASENGHYFENIIACNDDGDWIQYGENIKIKKITHHTFVAVEIVANSMGGYFCLLHILKLSEYTATQLEEYKENFPEYRYVYEDEEFFAAASIAAVLSVDDAESAFFAEDDNALESWVTQIEDKYSVITE